MNNEQIITKIREFMIDEFEVEDEKITPDANLKSTLGLDSLDYIDLVVVIESNFKFKVKPEDFVGHNYLPGFLQLCHFTGKCKGARLMSSWQGKSRGNKLGYRIFVGILKNFGVLPAYFVLRIVVVYFFLFSYKASSEVFDFYHRRLGYTFLQTLG
jgi:acyl carrier protein